MSIVSKLFIKKSSVQQKMLLAFLCLIVFPLGVFGYTSLAITKRTIEEQAGAAKLKSLGLISQKLEIMASDLTAISNIYFSNDDLRSLLLAPPENQAYQERAKSQFLTKLIVTYRYAYTWLEYYTSIFGFNGTELHTFYGGNKIGIDSIKAEPWYPQAAQLNGGTLWVSNPSKRLIPTINEDHYVSVVRLLKDFEADKAVGLLMINVGESFLYNQYAEAAQKEERMLLFDKDGVIISARDKGTLGQKLGQEPYYHQFTDNTGHFKEQIDGRPMLVTYHKVESTGWTIVCYTPLDSLLQNIDQAEWYTLIVFSFVLGLSIIVSYVIASRFSIPIRRLYVSMKKVEMGDLSERSTIRGSDEVGELAQKFNRMVARIEELRDKVIEEQQLKRRTELQNLQSQINTHFLYNTLASIRSLLLTDTPAKVDSVIVALVKLLRKTLSAESEYIPIAEELDNLRNYVHIQMARQYGELFVEFDIEERIEPYGTLKLLLQPIVENAIFHGIEPKNGPGRIIVKGWMEGDNVRFRIRDDGVGIALAEGPDGAKTLTEQMLSSAGGMGLRNVQHRMRLHFGDSYGIEVHSLLEGGTAIDLTWPVFIRIEELKRK